MQLTPVDLAVGYGLSPCAYLPKPGGDSIQLMHTETEPANMQRFAKQLALPLSPGWRSRGERIWSAGEDIDFCGSDKSHV